MAQINIATRLAATYCGIETVFGTTSPTMVRCFPDSGTMDLSGIDQSVIDVPDERTRGFKHIVPVLGYKSVNSSIKAEYKLRPDGTQLTDVATVPVTPPWLNLILRGALGNSASSYTAQQGCLLSATPGSGATINVVAGKGVNFVVGQWIAIQTSIGLELARITAIATDALTIIPSVTGTPVATTGKVINLYNFAPDQLHSASMTFQHAKFADTNQQWELDGCLIDSLGFSFERNGLPKFSLMAKPTTWFGPVNSPNGNTISTAVVADTMVAPPATRNATVLIQGIATTTKVSYAAHKFGVTTKLGMMQVPEFNGIEGVNGLLRIPERPFGQVTVAFPSDPSRTIDFTSQNKLSIVFQYVIGSGITARYIVIDCPTCVIRGAPKFSDESGRMITTITADLFEDETNAIAPTNMSAAPYRIAIG